MNICFFSYYRMVPSLNGVNRVCTILADELNRRGNYKLFSAFLRDYPENVSQSWTSIIKLPSQNPYDFQNVTSFVQFVQDNQIDVILHVTDMEALHDIAYAVKQRTTCKLISVCHVDPFWQTKSLIDNYAELSFTYSGFSLLLKQLFFLSKYPVSFALRRKRAVLKHQKIHRESDAYVFLSEEDAKMVRGIVEETPVKKIFAINNPIDGISCEYLFKKNQVLFVGRLEFQKRVDRLLRIWANVESANADWELVIVGDGGFENRLRRYTEELHLHRVRFEGYHTYLTSYYEQAKIVVMTSSHEGFPMCISEAMRKGCIPILFNSFNSAHLIVNHSVNGILIKPFNEKKFASCLFTIMSNESLRETMSSHTSEKIHHFDVQEIASEWEVMLNKI